MTRRLVYIAFGAAVGVLAVRRATQTAQRFTPAGVQDTVAGALAGALNAKRMLLLTDVAGVLDANGALMRQMSVAQARAAIDDGVATGGMIPKLETAIAAVQAGVEAVVIMDGRRPHALLVELFTEHGAGTLICE